MLEEPDWRAPDEFAELAESTHTDIHPANGKAENDQPRRCTGVLRGYLTHDRDAAEALIADDFVFTSPQDDHIDRAAFFEHCFPTAGRVRTQELLHAISSDGDDVFVMYEYELLTGERHRSVEVLTVRDSKGRRDSGLLRR